uniref:SEC63 domain-containing protein n=1 Tax=Glossina austeni TaxID=7395 RepID=A0A1A9VH86_GLOAU
MHRVPFSMDVSRHGHRQMSVTYRSKSHSRSATHSGLQNYWSPYQYNGVLMIIKNLAKDNKQRLEIKRLDEVSNERLNIGARYIGTAVHCPKCPKGKNEAWFLTLGSQANGDLLAKKHVNLRALEASSRATFQYLPRKGRSLLTLYLLSDCLISFVQKYDLQFDRSHVPIRPTFHLVKKVQSFLE